MPASTNFILRDDEVGRMSVKRHRVLVIGVGSIGERHLRCFQSTGRVDVSFVEVNPTLRATIAERYSVANAFDSLDAAMASPPDIAVICTPAPLHIPQATHFAEAGIPILIEKPLSTTLNGVEELIALVKRRNVTASVAYVYRAHPVLASMREALHSGRFGAPVEIIAVGGQHFPTYRPAYRTIYYRDRATGGGAIQDALTHVFNAAEWLVGPMDRVVADASHQVLEGVEVEDTAHVLARHGNVMGTYTLNQYQAPNEGHITVVCERGTVRFEIHNRLWKWMEKPETAWTEEALTVLERDTLFVAQANAFLDAVEGKCPVACTIEEAYQTLRVNLACLASLESGRWESTRANVVDADLAAAAAERAG
jgi:predicted dehydrogenase